MFNRRYFQGPVGKASFVSIVAMAAFVALSAQLHATPAFAANQTIQVVELA